MRNKSLFLLLACVCGTVAAIGVSQWMQAQNTGRTSLKMVEIFVTAQAITANEEITPEKIRLEEWPADKVPQGATSDISQLEGLYAKQAFYAGEPVMPIKLVTDKDAIIVPQGFIVVSMPVNSENGVSSLLRPGDRVDVNGYFKKSDVIPRTMMRTVLAGVRVFAIDGETVRKDEEKKKRPTPPRTISLLIQKADAEAWNMARELGKLSLSLGAPGDYPETVDDSDQSEAAAGFMTWLAEYQEEKQAALAAAANDQPEPEPVAMPEPEPAKATFRMVKMVNGRMVEYEFVDGSLIPRIVAQTDEKAGKSTGPSSDDTPKAAVPTSEPPPVGEDDYGYLTGEDSPFFQGGEPPAGFNDLQRKPRRRPSGSYLGR
jgi:pilus assembly protein CpaB